MSYLKPQATNKSPEVHESTFLSRKGIFCNAWLNLEIREKRKGLRQAGEVEGER